MNFTHLDDTSFPGVDNINVFKYKNKFDYKRWLPNVKIKLMNVQWDDTNVPGFESVAERDAWMNAHTGRVLTLTSALYILPDNTIDLPVPFDEMSAFNYVMVDFPIMTSPENPIDYETGTGINKFFFFIWAVESKAPNTTHCMLQRDDWVTYINSCEINYLMLERGHAPVAKTNVDTYLSNPIENNDLLLAPDVNYGVCTNIKSSDDVILNDGTMYACIATTADPSMAWGSKGAGNWSTPAASSYNIQGAPACYTFAIEVNSLASFMENIDANIPQFKQTVQAVFFASEKLLSIGVTFSFANTICYNINAKQIVLDLIDLNKDKFSYDDKYKNLAKLYTYPYAQIEVTDESGNTTLVNIEDTIGYLDVACALSIAYPLVGIDAHILGYGGSNVRTISFENINEHSIIAQGAWYKTLKHWNVPTFAVIQSANTYNDYNTHFDREQEKVAYDNAYDTAVNSANTGKANADASATTANTNAHVGTTAQTNISNRNIQTNTGKTSEQNSFINAQATLNGDKLSNDTDADRIYLSASTMVGTDSVASSAWTNAVSGVAANTGMGLMAGSLPGAGAGVISGIVSGASTVASSSIIISKEQSLATLAENNMLAKFGNAYQTLNSLTARTNTYNNAIRDLDNNNITDTTNLSVDSTNTQADNARDTTMANASRTQTTSIENAATNRNTAISGVANQIAQAGLSAPGTFGQFSGDSSAITRPMVISANIVTQPKAAIAQAGDQMLRYGYALNRQWNIDTFNVMAHFSYWKASEVWIVPKTGAVEGAREHLSDMLERGITVWRNPYEIGKVGIYENV